MGQMILYGVGALLLYNFWAWVIRHIFTHHKGRWMSLHILIVGTVSTSIIFFFPKLVDVLGLIQGPIISNLNIPVVFTYIGYLFLCSCGMYLGYVQKMMTSNVFITIGVFLAIYVVIGIGGSVLGLPTFILYVSLVAFGEEYIKYMFGFSLFEKMRIHYTDLLLFCLVSGFAFAFIENGFYIRYAIEPGRAKTDIMQKIAIAMQTLTQRGLVNVGVHGFFTSLVALCTLTPSLQNAPWRKSLLGMILGMGVHTLFNALVSQKITIIIPIFVVISFGFVSYILFKADSFYNQPAGDGIANT